MNDNLNRGRGKRPPKEIPPTGEDSRPGWETVEASAQENVKRWRQRLLEEEVEEALGWRRAARGLLYLPEGTLIASRTTDE